MTVSGSDVVLPPLSGAMAGRPGPDPWGLDYENVAFPSIDGVSLEGWFFPADSDKSSSTTISSRETATATPGTCRSPVDWVVSRSTSCPSTWRSTKPVTTSSPTTSGWVIAFQIGRSPDKRLTDLRRLVLDCRCRGHLGPFNCPYSIPGCPRALG